MRHLKKLIALIPVAICFTIILPALSQTNSTLPTNNIERATVFIIQARRVGERLVTSCVGTGTIVSRNGLVLTNAHHTVQSATCPGDVIIVAVNLRPDQPPVPSYRADVVQADVGLDIAILRINRELSGRFIEPTALTLPFVQLGDSSTLSLDQTLTIVGYPSLENEPLQTLRTTIISFLSEPRGDRAWIKTNAPIPATMTGGGAYDQQGRLVAIPTIAPLSTRGISDTACKYIEDSNLDGLVNTSDNCVPIGNPINTLRPSSFIRPLLRSANLELQVASITSGPSENQPIDRPTFSRLFFSPSVVNNLPTTVVNSLPTGTTSLYIFFDYANMTPENVYELRVTIDGIPNQSFSLSPVRWSGGRNGTWYIGSSGQPWPNGTYEFRLFVDGVAVANKSFIIGGAPQQSPFFSNIAFGLLDTRGNIIGNGYVLPIGSIASARFIYQNMPNDIPWAVLWYYNGTEIIGARSTDTWKDGPSGSKTVGLQPVDGLIPGNYRIELYIDNILSATADFVVAGAQEGAFPRIFSNAHFASADSPLAAISAPPANNFSAGVESIYALFDWEQIAPGTSWTMRWSVDEEIFFEQTIPWNATMDGENFVLRLSTPIAIPDGTYQFELLINGVPLAEATARVGIGQLPIDPFSTASGIQLSGYILDADSRMGLEGVTIILLSEAFSVEDFVWSQEQIFALANTDRNGYFELNRLLAPEVPYSVIIVADGYLPLTADGFEFPPESPRLVEMIIPLTKD